MNACTSIDLRLVTECCAATHGACISLKTSRFGPNGGGESTQGPLRKDPAYVAGSSKGNAGADCL